MEEQIQCIKQLLLETNPSNFDKDSNTLNNENLFNEFINSFQILFNLLQKNESNINNKLRVTLIDSFSIWLSRSTQIISNKNIESKVYSQSIAKNLLTEKNINYIFQYIIDFWIDGGSPLMNALTDLFKKLLTLLKSLEQIFDANFHTILLKWLDEILRIPSSLRVQYYLINILAYEKIDLYRIIEQQPEFIESCLSLLNINSLANPVGKCLTSVLINIYHNHYQGCDHQGFEKNWLKLWKDPLFKQLEDEDYTKPIGLYILIPLFRKLPSEAYSLFIRESSYKNFPTRLISILKVSQELFIEEDFNIENLISLNELKLLLTIDRFKLSIFEILTYSNKKSKEIPSYIFPIIQNNLKSFFQDQNIESRNYFCSSFKNFILRMKDSSYSLHRDMKKLQKAKKFPVEEQEKRKKIDEYKSFLIWLIKFLKLQLIPGSSYERVLLSLQLLITLVESGLDSNVPEKFLSLQTKDSQKFWVFQKSLFQDKALFQLLLCNITNTYNDIRQLSKYLLSIAFDKDLIAPLSRVNNREELTTELISIAKNNLKVYQDCETKGASILEFLFIISEDKYQFITNILNDLENSITIYMENELENVENPIAGYFITLSSILSRQVGNELDENCTATIAQKCIDLTIKNWDAMRDIVCHDSSDGLLPERFLTLKEISDQTVTSFSFRSIKESSLLLELIISKFRLSDNQLFNIGEILIEQLFNIRHSGAFQSVLPTFKTFCRRCRKDNYKQLNTWLDSILQQMEVKKQHITRRSGGLPFLITSILSTETDKTHPQLKYTFDKLAYIASIPVVEFQDKLDLPQVNAFNCIKAIFIDSKLSEPCTPYVSEAAMLSLKYFNSDIWALRNCSIMLFTSLKNRIFGKIGRSMNARLFFSKFTGLRDILHATLKQSVQKGSKFGASDNIESIFLILNILLQLKPTPGYDGLDDFIDLIIECLGNKNWKIRDIAARTYISISSESSHIIIHKISNTLSVREENKLHGHLLATYYLIENILVPEHLETEQLELLTLLISKVSPILLQNVCYITAKTYVQSIRILLESLTEVPRELLFKFIQALGNYFIYHNSTFAIDGSKQLCLSEILEVLLSYENEPNTLDLCCLGLESPFYEVKSTALKFVIEKIDFRRTKLSPTLAIILKDLFYDNNLLSTVKPLIMQAFTKADISLSFAELMVIVKGNTSEAMKLMAIKSLGPQINRENISLSLQIFDQYLTDDTPSDFRMAALECLMNCSEVWKSAELLLHAYSSLTDDDPDIRDFTAKVINEQLFGRSGCSIDQNPIITSKLFLPEVYKILPARTVAAAIWTRILYFFNQFDIFSTNTVASNILFENEKDNQYRDIVDYIMDLLKIDISGAVAKEIKDFGDAVLKNLNAFLIGKSNKKQLVSWFHNPDVFVRLVIIMKVFESTHDKQSTEILNILNEIDQNSGGILNETIMSMY
ncbi:tRNA methylation protein TRM732 NDAI_0K00600 [Naumovozyma dairenensis CBS 421]|uniref:Uncharacterized protein n=1 Tax=Naumovozyma dairenensis (strain ATCC 10597 / BCRC 20456 / CBS 421 / NBRC 0211 / NRRL Y-12639) TaxID=1071378 RepID=G0WHJ0_NAUDC|nr:hypothetical protein NDAI_0K00600 [Naumovozyma dairenensis CBS 421]CCD27251.1 hypothetical protein NDAI_0K00600 [Naumovozyma dairenensis CBS 421]